MPINTPKQRQLQSERIKRVKPWLKATGPKTQAGKDRSKMNALKSSPAIHELMKQYKSLMKQQREVDEVVRLRIQP